MRKNNIFLAVVSTAMIFVSIPDLEAYNKESFELNVGISKDEFGSLWAFPNVIFHEEIIHESFNYSPEHVFCEINVVLPKSMGGGQIYSITTEDVLEQINTSSFAFVDVPVHLGDEHPNVSVVYLELSLVSGHDKARLGTIPFMFFHDEKDAYSINESEWLSFKYRKSVLPAGNLDYLENQEVDDMPGVGRLAPWETSMRCGNGFNCISDD